MGHTGTTELKWYATKAFSERAYVLKYLELEGASVSRIKDIPSLIFIHCTQTQVRKFRNELYGKLYVYRAAESTEPEAIPDNEMNTFLLLAPFHKEPVMYMAVDDPHFFEGQRKRVTQGAFLGCEGVIKRIKGARRLIVRISDKAAIATPYIPKDFLEDIS